MVLTDAQQKKQQQQKQLPPEYARIFCFVEDVRPGTDSCCLVLPAARTVEPDARPFIFHLQDGVFMVSVRNSQRERIPLIKGTQLGWGQPIYIKKLPYLKNHDVI